MKPDSIMQEKRIAESLQGLPTATMTTNTLTPTTLRSITQIFESDGCLDNIQKIKENEIPTSAGFEPPTVLPVIASIPVTTVDSFLNLSTGAVEVSSTPGLPTVVPAVSSATRTSYANLGSTSWQGGLTTVVTPSSAMPLPGENMNASDDEDYKDDDKDEDYEPEIKRRNIIVTRKSARKAGNAPKTPTTIADRAPKRKVNNKGGRKPAGGRGADEDSLSAVEKKKLTVRRERNKEAAARCRQRRVDLINKLSGEVEVWEGKRKSLEEEIQMLTQQRDELAFILQSHSQVCKLQINKIPRQQQPVMVAVKSEPPTVASSVSPVVVEPVNAHYILPEVSAPSEKPSRPVSLALTPATAPKAVSPKVQGVDIETPSAIIPSGINFDSIVSTGLTPTVVFNTVVTPLAGANTLNTPTCSRQHQQQVVAGDSAIMTEYLQL